MPGDSLQNWSGPGPVRRRRRTSSPARGAYPFLRRNAPGFIASDVERGLMVHSRPCAYARAMSLPSTAADLAAAVQILGERIRSALQGQPVVIVGITGPVGSGKSTLADRLCALSGDAVVLSTDNYLPDYAHVEPHERDMPEHADLARLHSDLTSLRSGRSTSVPVWSFHTHRREGEKVVNPAPLVVCEGIHALGEIPARALDLKVYVDAPRAVRWGRWEEIEQRGLRGFGVERARAHFDTVAEPTFDRCAHRYRAIADLVVLNHG